MFPSDHSHSLLSNVLQTLAQATGRLSRSSVSALTQWRSKAPADLMLCVSVAVPRYSCNRPSAFCVLRTPHSVCFLDVRRSQCSLPQVHGVDGHAKARSSSSLLRLTRPAGSTRISTIILFSCKVSATILGAPYAFLYSATMSSVRDDVILVSWSSAVVSVFISGDAFALRFSCLEGEL